MKTMRRERFMNITIRNMRTSAAILAATMLMPLAAPAAEVILANGNRVQGTAIRAQRNGDIVLTTSIGQQTFTRGQYQKAIADRPAEFDQARTLHGQGKHEEALALLEKVATDYRYLDWDNQALMAVGQIQGSRGNFKESIDAYERLLAQSPELKNESTILWAYRDALLKGGMHDKLSPVLDEAVKSGSRNDAAKAQVMRGDIRMANGQLEAAAMDYLRSAILFESEKDVQPEALFKAGQALEKLRDARAGDMYRKVAEKYPDSPYAQDARGKM